MVTDTPTRDAARATADALARSVGLSSRFRLWEAIEAGTLTSPPVLHTVRLLQTDCADMSVRWLSHASL